MVAAAALAASLAFVPVAFAAEGDLDPSFGTGGTVTTPVGSDDFANAVAIDSQGRIVVAGSSYNGSNSDFAVARYNPDGGLDTSFGANNSGKVTTPFGSGSDYANAVAIDSQGRIVVAGRTNNGSNDDFALARYDPNGSLDTSFGPGHTGKVTMDLFGAKDEAFGVAIDAQGRIVAGGTSRVGGDDDFSVARFDSSGNPDNSFSSDGKANVDFTPVGADQDEANAMALDAQGRIVLAGKTDAHAAGAYDFALARLNTDGSRDAMFGPAGQPAGHEGQVTTPVGSGDDSASAVAIDPQGRIIAAGQSFSGASFDFGLVRYNPDGSLDTSFNGTGKVMTPIGSGSDSATAVAIDPQGRIVAAGSAHVGSNDDFALARYSASGGLDPSFGSAGKVTTPFSAGFDRANAVTIDAQDRIVTAGSAAVAPASNDDFALARYIGDQTPPNVTIDAGPADGSFINDSTPTFDFSVDDASASFTCTVDGNAQACSSPFTPSLADGGHTVSISANDAASNSTTATRTFTVDTKAPTVTIKGKAKLKTRKRTARERLKINVSEAAIVACAVDKRKPNVCGAKYRTPKLKRGKHRLTVTATDQAGNTATAGKRIRVVRKSRR